MRSKLTTFQVISNRIHDIEWDGETIGDLRTILAAAGLDVKDADVTLKVGKTIMQVHDGVKLGPFECLKFKTEAVNCPAKQARARAFIRDKKRNEIITKVQSQNQNQDDVNEEISAKVATIPRRGIVTVKTNGGLQSTNVTITVGETMVHDAIYNDTVRARSGMTDVQLSNCIIMLNEDELKLYADNSHKLIDGDIICLGSRRES